MSALGNQNVSYVEALYARYVADPGSVSDQWRTFFDSLNGDGVPDPFQLGPTFEQRSIFNPFGNGRAATATPPEPAATGRPAGAAPPAAPPPAKVEEAVAHKAALLKRMPLFRGMSDEDRRALAPIALEVTFEPDELVCAEGDVGEDLYLVTEGSVFIRTGGQIIAELGVGEIVGELAVLDSRPRTADVLAHGRARMLQIRGTDFQSLLAKHATLGLGLLKVLAARVRETSARQRRVDALVRAYRTRGHVLAKLDPLGRPSGAHPELTLAHYGLDKAELDTSFSTRIGGGFAVRTLRQILELLKNTYCGPIGVQYMHIDDLDLQEWLRVRMEDSQNERMLSPEEQVRILTKLTDAEVFEDFLHRKFVGAKRFSLEGAESLIPLLDYAIEEAGDHGVEEVVIGMAHRGRLNVLVNILEKSARQIFREFEDVDPDLHIGRGDVKYHMGKSSDRVTASGKQVHLSLSFNPSHLEAVAPVVLGRTRAKQDRHGDAQRQRALPILIHGDAAFAGQGVVQELFNMSELPGYSTGGAVHIIVNNQIGFTTSPEEARSSQYATDVARMLQIPVFHVNGENPEAVAQVIQLAMDFRDEFNRDVVIDMYCYRRHGHNEGDDPTFTQPLLYETIRQRPTVREAYVRNLLKLGGLSEEQADEIAIRSRERLEADLAASRTPGYEYQAEPALRGLWSRYRGGADSEVEESPTGVPKERLAELLTKMSAVPSDFKPHRKIERFLDARRAMAAGNAPLNWGAAEAVALATLVTGGHRVRLSGQDSQRGTFGHRHSVLHDVENGGPYVPLQHMSADQAPFDVYNSPLSEVGVVGFEYGYSLDYPDGLTIWEAQFGDFSNVAQVIIDQFICSAEDKWNRLSGLTMLLPHGFEGQGPEHSSARLERWLMLAAQDNVQVVNLTTPAQIFHCLRRQVVRPWRKPLVVMSPKSLLRHPKAVSSLEELAEGHYQKVIPDAESAAGEVGRILLCSGKVYYELTQFREEHDRRDVAIVRLEQYYPLPIGQLDAAIDAYPSGTPIIWVQEEPENMGAWPFLHLSLWDGIIAVTRPESASPATGSAASHRLEQAELIEKAFGVEG